MSQVRAYQTFHRMAAVTFDALTPDAIGVIMLAEALKLFGQHGWQPCMWLKTEIADRDEQFVHLQVSWSIATVDGRHGAWGESWD